MQCDKTNTKIKWPKPCWKKKQISVWWCHEAYRNDSLSWWFCKTLQILGNISVANCTCSEEVNYIIAMENCIFTLDLKSGKDSVFVSASLQIDIVERKIKFKINCCFYFPPWRAILLESKNYRNCFRFTTLCNFFFQ